MIILALTLQFVPYNDIEHLKSEQRISKLLGIVKKNNVVLMQGRLKPEEETMLIQKTMEEISREFKGVEICTIFPEAKNMKFSKKLKTEMLKFVLGHRDGITIIGPASVIKEIRRDPNKIQLFTFNVKKNRRK